MKILQKIGTGIITGALLTSIMATGVSAHHHSGGNSTVVINKTNCTVSQANASEITTGIDSNANSGLNTANENTGGKHHSPATTVGITTDDAMSDVIVGVGGSGNSATSPCCPCNTPTVTTSTDTGKNKSFTLTSNSTTITQSNSSSVDTSVSSNANTGGNTANENTGANVTISTGEANSAVTVEVTGSTNSIL